MLLHIYANLWLKIPKFGGVKKIWQLFDISKILKKSALFGPANSQLVTYSKIQTKVCRVTWGTPMDWFLIKSVNAEYPLSCRKYVEKQTFCVLWDAGPPKCVTPPPPNGTTIYPSYLPIYKPWDTLKPSHSFMEKKLIFWTHLFLANYSNSPGVAKNWHMSKLTKKGPRRCHKVSWVQIWQKNSNGTCPKLPKRNSHVWCH